MSECGSAERLKSESIKSEPIGNDHMEKTLKKYLWSNSKPQ